EIELIAGIVLHHRKRSPGRDDLAPSPLDREGRLNLRVLAGILRLADGLDRSHFQVIETLQVRVVGELVTLHLTAREDPELELWAAGRKGRLFEAATGARLRFVVRGGAPAAGVPRPGTVR